METKKGELLHADVDDAPGAPHSLHKILWIKCSLVGGAWDTSPSPPHAWSSRSESHGCCADLDPWQDCRVSMRQDLVAGKSGEVDVDKRVLLHAGSVYGPIPWLAASAAWIAVEHPPL
jgi:hypothetical protein